MTASERILSFLREALDANGESCRYFAVHEISWRLGDVSACSVSARLRELHREAKVAKRKRGGKPYDEWRFVGPGETFT